MLSLPRQGKTGVNLSHIHFRKKGARCLLVHGELHEYRFDPNSPCRHLFVHFDIDKLSDLISYRLLSNFQYSAMRLRGERIGRRLRTGPV